MLGVLGDRRHHRHGLDRVCRPIAVSWESIRASVPSRIALATSVTSARVGRGEKTIDSSICVAVITGRASAAREGDDPLLHERDLLDLQLDPEVPAGHHHAVGRVGDRLRALHRAALLDLGDQRVSVCSRTSLTSSGLRTKESATMSTPDAVARSAEAPRSSSGIVGSDGELARDVDALPREDRPADLHARCRSHRLLAARPER